MECAACSEPGAAARYLRLNPVTGTVESLCRGCWLTLRHSKEGGWRYLLGVSRLFLLFTILPLLAVGALIAWVAVAWLR